MNDTVGPLLKAALQQIAETEAEDASIEVAARLGAGRGSCALPVVAQLHPRPAIKGESWEEYKQRTHQYLSPQSAMLRDALGGEVQELYAANSLRTGLSPEQVKFLSERGEPFRWIELDPLVQVTAMDDAIADLGLPDFRGHSPEVDGSGVIVAVLDSGVDLHHPYLQVADSVSTCGESVDIPGSHGTHCAGSIASKDSFYPGVAPGVKLLNVKVLDASGRGRHTSITAGVDEALDRGAQVLSLSLGLNHLPKWSANGHGWSCADGRCPLCTAVDNASNLDDTVVVVAAGNEHERAEALRKWGFGSSFDTELGCPGHARSAITVAAVTKQTFLPASFSSQGPTAYGTPKPDLAAPGVNITSTIPVPRQANGQPVSDPQRNLIFGRMSGTSMATPLVAGAAALLIQIAQQEGSSWSPGWIKQTLVANAVLHGVGGPHQIGAGRLNLDRL